MAYKRIEIDYNKVYNNYTTISRYDSDTKRYVSEKIYWPFRVIGEDVRKGKHSVNRIIQVEFVYKNMYGFNSTKIATISAINKANLNDDYLPTYCGVGCIGQAKTKINNTTTPEYTKWRTMISNCYNKNKESYDKYATTVYVDKMWLCYEYFCNTLPQVQGYQDWISNNKTGYDLNKDYLQYDSPIKIYSPSTCIFLPRKISGSLSASLNGTTAFNYELPSESIITNNKILYTMIKEENVKSESSSKNLTINDVVGSIVPNKYGDIEILRYFKTYNNDGSESGRYITVRFVNKNPYGFNTIRDVVSSRINLNNSKLNTIRDPYQFDVGNGSGCLGFYPKQFKPGCKEYNVWYNMIRRCYDKSDNMYYTYGNHGVTVDIRWRCYEYFLYDLPYVEGYDLWKRYPSEYELDKDIKQINKPVNERVYSLSTCCFIKKSYNMMEKNRRNNNHRFTGVGYTNNNTFKVIILGKIYGEYTSEIAAARKFNELILQIDPDFPKELLNNV